MLSESVAQKPTMPVSEGKKNAQNAAESVNLAGCARMGPSPLPAANAPPKQAHRPHRKEKRLNTSSLRMLSTPLWTTYIFRAQNKTNSKAGPVARPQLAGKMAGSVPSEGSHSTAI